jgi:hypothetical protein
LDVSTEQLCDHFRQSGPSLPYNLKGSCCTLEENIKTLAGPVLVDHVVHLTVEDLPANLNVPFTEKIGFRMVKIEEGSGYI